MFKKDKKKKTELERVEERREEILSAGRKFKYPMQWTKYRIVVDTILIAFLLIGILAVGGWFALYRLQDTGEVIYRVTRIVPAAVAEVDGEKVRFSDYLMLYRSSILSIERQSLGDTGSEEEKKLLMAQYKKEAISKAEEYTYALKLGKELGLKISDEEIDQEFERHQKTGGVERSEESFLKIVKDNFGLSKDEYKRMLYLALMKSKVEGEIDEEANTIAKQVEKLLSENGGNYAAVAEVMGDKISYEETGGLVTSKNIDGGRANAAMKLEPGEQSGRFVSMNGDGYYFVKLIAKSEAEVNFVSIKVSFSEFRTRFGGLKEAGKIKEYINLE